MRTFEGKFDGRNVKIGIVAGRFNEFITSKLVGGALDVLKEMMFLKKILILPGFQGHLKYL